MRTHLGRTVDGPLRYREARRLGKDLLGHAVQRRADGRDSWALRDLTAVGIRTRLGSDGDPGGCEYSETGDHRRGEKFQSAPSPLHRVPRELHRES